MAQRMIIITHLGHFFYIKDEYIFNSVLASVYDDKRFFKAIATIGNDGLAVG